MSSVCVSWVYCSMNVKTKTCKRLYSAKIMNAFALLLRVWSAKTWRSPNWSPWLTTPLLSGVYLWVVQSRVPPFSGVASRGQAEWVPGPLTIQNCKKIVEGKKRGKLEKEKIIKTRQTSWKSFHSAPPGRQGWLHYRLPTCIPFISLFK